MNRTIVELRQIFEVCYRYPELGMNRTIVELRPTGTSFSNRWELNEYESNHSGIETKNQNRLYDQ